MKKTFPSIRVTTSTANKVERAIEKYNEENIMPINKQEFRRLAYEFFATKLLSK